MLSVNAVQSITEALQKLFPAPLYGAVEAFEELGRLAQDDEKEVKQDDYRGIEKVQN